MYGVQRSSDTDFVSDEGVMSTIQQCQPAMPRQGPSVGDVGMFLSRHFIKSQGSLQESASP